MLRKVLRPARRALSFRKQSVKLFACSRRLQTMPVLSEEQRAAAELTMELIDNASHFRVMAVSSALLECGVFDALSEAAQSSAELAAKCELNEEMVARMLRFAASHGYGERSADGRWTHNSKSLALCCNPSIRGQLSIYASPLYTAPYIGAAKTLRSGVDALQLEMGAPLFEYLSQNPKLSKTWSEYMKGLNWPQLMAFIAEGVDWSQFERVADVAGGLGPVIAAIMDRHPTVEGVLFDRAEVIAEANEFWKQQPATVRLLTGDFFEAKDTAQLSGADCVVLKCALSDQRDADALRLLRNLRAPLRCGNGLVIVEPGVVDDANGAQMPLVKEFDVHMAVITGGKMRSVAELDALFEATGFQRTNVVVDDNVPGAIIQAKAID